MLTELSIRALQPPEKGARIVYCDSVTGFGVRVTKNNVKSYILTHGARRTRETTLSVRITLGLKLLSRRSIRRLLGLCLLGSFRRIQFGGLLRSFPAKHRHTSNR